MHHVFITVSEHATGDAQVLEFNAREIAQNGFGCCAIHSQIMMRALVLLDFLRMAFDAGIAPDISRLAEVEWLAGAWSPCVTGNADHAH